MHTFWVTFYSYKGGVGRSMALANVAAEMASLGRRVLMVDFDLEAPGLDAFEELCSQEPSQGVVEYVSRYLETDIAPPVEDYLQEISCEKVRPGKLWVMRAGRKDAKYNQLRSAINWGDLYENKEGAAFFENFKEDIHDKLKPDYVFVDSRTGLTDVGGVCTLHLPDLVVLLFSLNEQNLQGISSVAKVLRRTENAPALLPVATPVPNLAREKDGLLQDRFKRAKELLGVEVERFISYSPEIALKEQIVVWGQPQRLQFEYEELATSIRNLNPQGIDFLLQEADAALNNLEFVRLEEICDALTLEYPDRADAWLKVADIRRSDKDLIGYEEALRNALKINPNDINIFNRLENLLRSQGNEEKALELAINLLQMPQGVDAQNKRIIEVSSSQVFMSLGKYTEAAAALERAQQYVKKGEFNHVNEYGFVDFFNLLEARRRSGFENSRDDWRLLTQVYEQSAIGAGTVPPSNRLNQMQAMHIAYALSGQLDKAIKILEEVERVGEGVSSRERIFSVKDYEYVSKEEFMGNNKKMLFSLYKSQLWDGFEI